MGIPVPGLAPNVTWLELARVVFALVGLLVTLGSVGYMLRALDVMAIAVSMRVATWEGPRGRFVVGMTAAMVLSIPVWITYIWIGWLAMNLPEATTPERREVAQQAGMLHIIGEFFQMMTQVILLGVWVFVRSARGFVPTVDRRRAVK